MKTATLIRPIRFNGSIVELLVTHNDTHDLVIHADWRATAGALDALEAGDDNVEVAFEPWQVGRLLPKSGSRADVRVAGLFDLFEQAHADHPQYDGWTDSAVAQVVVNRLNGGGTSFTRAEPGDVVLVKRKWVGFGLNSRFEVTAYCPRVGWNVAIRDYDVRDLTDSDLVVYDQIDDGPTIPQLVKAPR